MDFELTMLIGQYFFIKQGVQLNFIKKTLRQKKFLNFKLNLIIFNTLQEKVNVISYKFFFS